MALPAEILAEGSVLFHDTRLDQIEPERHAEFVVTRVLDRGTLRSVTALLKYYGRDRIRTILLNGGLTRISKRTAPLWIAFLQLTPEECASKPSPRFSSPFWSA
jgi:hypothetical protein